MKILKLLAIILVIGIVAISCKKETGPQGTAGVNGTNGTNGNANVTVYGFPGLTYSTSLLSMNFTLPISPAHADSSLILPYYKTQGLWFAAGEIGIDAGYLTRYYIFPNIANVEVFIKMLNVDGSTYTGADVIFDSVKVYVIPANIFKSTPAGKVNFKNYQSVKSYYDVK